MLRSLISANHSNGALRNRPLFSRGLATSVVYIRHLPSTASLADLTDIAKQHGTVYGIWKSSDKDSGGRKRPAAIRMVTENVPRDIQEIAQLPLPTDIEISQITSTANIIAEEIRAAYQIDAVAVMRDPDMFQSASRKIARQRHGSSDFDVLTTSKPRYTRGMIDGYRRGFAEAKKMHWRMLDLKECSADNEDDQMRQLTEYFEHRRHRQM